MWHCGSGKGWLGDTLAVGKVGGIWAGAWVALCNEKGRWQLARRMALWQWARWVTLK